MKMPAEQEQDVIKCKHCHKFFVSKSYLKKHYARHHPEHDFYRDFKDEGDNHIIHKHQESPSP